MNEHKWHESLKFLREGENLLSIESSLELTNEIIKIRENFPSVLPETGIEMCHYYWLNNIENCIINIGKLRFEKPVFKCGDIPVHVKIEIDRLIKVLNLWSDHVTIFEIKENYSFVYYFAKKLYDRLGNYDHKKSKFVKLLINYLYKSHENEKAWKWLDENIDDYLLGINPEEKKDFCIALKKGGSFWCNFNFIQKIYKLLEFINGSRDFNFYSCKESLKHLNKYYSNAYLGTIALRNVLKAWISDISKDQMDKRINFIGNFIYDYLGEKNEMKEWLVRSLISVLDYWLKQYSIFKEDQTVKERING